MPGNLQAKGVANASGAQYIPVNRNADIGGALARKVTGQRRRT